MANDEKNESGFAHDHNKRMLSRRKAMTNKNNGILSRYETMANSLNKIKPK